MKPNQFLKHAAVYGLSALLVQAGGVILLPMYTRCLTPAEYAVLEILTRLGETVATILVIGGMRVATLTLYQQCGSESERRGVVTGSMLSLLIGCALGGGLALALASWFGGWLHSDDVSVTPTLIRLAILCIVLEPLILIPMALMQARTESLSYALTNIGLFLLRVGLCVLFVACLRLGVGGVQLATALTLGLFGVGLSVRELRRGIRWPGWRQLKMLWRFALPFLPGGLCFFLLHHGDRYWLWACCANKAEIGTYGLGYRLAMMVAMFTLAPLHLVWSPRIYEAARAPDAATQFGVVFTRILGAYLIVGLGLCLFRQEVVYLLAGPAYADASKVVVLVVLACFCQAAATLMDSAFYIYRRSDLKLWVTIATTVVMLALYSLLIPSYGAQGAALATLGGFFVLACGTWWVSQRLFPVRYEWGRLAGLVSVAGVLWLAVGLLPITPWTIVLKLGVWLGYLLLLWKTGLISPAEKQYALSLMRNVWIALRRLAPSRPDSLVEGA
jgi:O-antigen/teichoic acid export membrane protein